MAIASFDIEMQAMLRFGIDYIQANIDILDEIFSNFKESHLWKLYGDKEIAKIKKWVSETEIPVLTAWSLNPQRIPCLSVHIASSQEEVERAFFGDHAEVIEKPKDARIIVPQFVPDSYDEPSGTINVPKNIDLSLVRPAHIIKDAKDELYMITDVQEHTITIDKTGAALDPAKVDVQSFITTEKFKRGETYVQEAVDVGIHGHADQNTVLWLYYIAIWILLRFKPEFEKRCMDLTTWSASDFKRDSQYLGENIFSRWMRVSARTRVTWEETPYPSIDTLVADIETGTDNDNDGDEN